MKISNLGADILEDIAQDIIVRQLEAELQGLSIPLWIIEEEMIIRNIHLFVNQPDTLSIERLATDEDGNNIATEVIYGDHYV